MNRELLRRRVLVRDQVLGARDEVAHTIHLLLARAVILPAPPFLAATAHVCDRIDAAALDPRDARRREPGPLDRAIAAVRVEQRRRIARERRVLAPDDCERNLGA